MFNRSKSQEARLRAEKKVEDISFVRQGYVSDGEISISYKWEGWSHNGPMAAAELGYFMGNILRWYGIEDVVLVNKITTAFFKYFPEQKGCDYPSLSFTVDSGEGFEEKLREIDSRVKGFLNEIRTLCKEHPRDQSPAWLRAEKV